MTARPKARRVLHALTGLALTAAVIGLPLWLLAITSVKSKAESAVPNLAWPTSWHGFDNYAYAVTEGGVGLAFLGSVLIAVPSVLVVLSLGASAAWVLARRASRVMAGVYAVGIAGIILPPAVITTVLTLRSLGLDGSPLGMIGVYAGMFLSTSIFFITGFIRTIPLELEEAARIDGARPATVLIRIILPLLRPVLWTAAILVTIFIWNEVFFALFVLSSGPVTTMPLGLFNVASQSEYVKNWNYIFAYVVMMSVPMILAFVVGQRRIIAGVTSGAVK